MTHEINIIDDQHCKIAIDFTDEEVDLQAETKIIGNEAEARKYVQTFEKDIRRQNRHLFPLPEMPEPEEFIEE